MCEVGCTFARFDTVEQITPRPPLAGCSDLSGVAAPGAGRIARQANTQRREREFLVAGFVKYTDRS